MNGNKFILDTNAVVALLKGNEAITKILETASWIGISIITYLEFLSFPEMPEEDKLLFDSFIQRIDLIGIDRTNLQLLESVIKFKKLINLNFRILLL